eukprot:3692713-Prymnesium_polylepis.1
MGLVYPSSAPLRPSLDMTLRLAENGVRCVPSSPGEDAQTKSPSTAVAYGLWCAVRRYSDATRSCDASGT